jgi:hypothetical protein
VPKLGDAAAVYAGATPAKAVYLGGAQVWPLGPKIIWAQDFESGTIDGIFNQTGGNPVVEAASARPPSAYGLKCSGSPSWARRNFPNIGITVLRHWLMFTAVPTMALEFFSAIYGGLRIGINQPSRTIGALHGTAQAFPIDSGIVPVPNQWYLMDIRIDCRGPERLLDWRIDGVDLDPGAPYVAAPYMECSTYWGHSTGFSGSMDVRFDDIAVSQTYDDYPLGDAPVARMGPDPAARRISPPVAGPAIDGYVKGEL